MTRAKAAIVVGATVAAVVCLLVVVQTVLIPQQFATTTADTTNAKIAACYPKDDACSACQPILNGSTQHVTGTSRRFINLPKNLYPKIIGQFFMSPNGKASAGWISNGGPPGESLHATPDCWSTYFEFDGDGEVDLRVKSTEPNTPDYFVRFLVGPP